MDKPPTIGRQLDATLANLVTKDDLAATEERLRQKSASKEDLAASEDRIRSEMSSMEQRLMRGVIAAVNQAAELLRDDLREAGFNVRTRRRGGSGAE